jgi:hypothetical protein
MSDVKTERDKARRWLERKGDRPTDEKPLLERPLFLVTGYTDEDAGCWKEESGFMHHGPRIFGNWNEMAHMIVFPEEEVLGAEFGPLAGRAMDSFVDFGDLLREMMLELEPEAATEDDGYDVICHSMGGLDTVVALMGLAGVPPGQPPAQNRDALGKAHHLITLDTPFRGVPSMDYRRAMRRTEAHFRQGTALFRESADLLLVLGSMRELPTRVSQLTCYRAEGTSVLEVPMQSSNLYGITNEFAAEREATQYESFAIRGVPHSGPTGITASPVTIRHVFETRLGAE